MLEIVISNNGTQIQTEVSELIKLLLDLVDEEKERTNYGTKRLDADEICRRMRGRDRTKEGPRRGLHRTAMFLHSLSRENPGRLEFVKSTKRQTVFKLLIPLVGSHR